MQKLKHLLLSSSLFILSFAMVAIDSTAQTSKKQMAADWQRAKAYTAEYINAANDSVIASKPIAEMRTFGQQMLHLAEANFGIAAAASGKQSPYTFGQLEKAHHLYANKEALLKIVMESYDFVITTITEMDENKMQDSFKLFNWEVTRINALEKAFEHQTHHRGQTTVYLRINGIRPPEEKLF